MEVASGEEGEAGVFHFFVKNRAGGGFPGIEISAQLFTAGPEGRGAERVGGDGEAAASTDPRAELRNFEPTGKELCHPEREHVLPIRGGDLGAGQHQHAILAPSAVGFELQVAHVARKSFSAQAAS